MELLSAEGQEPWTTQVRTSGLMALLSHVTTTLQKAEHRKADGIPFSNRLARQYCSQLRTSVHGICRESLAVLVHIGVLEIATPAMVNFHVKQSTRYRMAPAFAGRTCLATDEMTTGCVRRKLATAVSRREKGLNRAFPVRAGVVRDLAKLSIPALALPTLNELLTDTRFRPSALVTFNAIANRAHKVRIKGSGQIVTSVQSCPRPLKPLLRLDGRPVALCDISSAHWMFLPRLVADRLAYCARRGDPATQLDQLAAEMQRLIELCSSGSFYETLCPEGAGPERIRKTKRIANVLMNSPETRARKNVIWRKLRQRFPLCWGIISAIKRNDHRHISRQLQHFTAQAINAALLDLQAQGLPAIPDTDCLIVREEDRAVACRAIGKAMFAETRGVSVMVGGIKYAPEQSPTSPGSLQ